MLSQLNFFKDSNENFQIIIINRTNKKMLSRYLEKLTSIYYRRPILILPIIILVFFSLLYLTEMISSNHIFKSGNSFSHVKNSYSFREQANFKHTDETPLLTDYNISSEFFEYKINKNFREKYFNRLPNSIWQGSHTVELPLALLSCLSNAQVLLTLQYFQFNLFKYLFLFVKEFFRDSRKCWRNRCSWWTVFYR